MMMLTMPVIPIVLAILYRQLVGEEEIPPLMVYLVIGVIFSSVTTSSLITMMAEETEKKTLRGLLLSPASILDIIVGKSLVTSLITLLTLLISLAILGMNSFMNFPTIIGIILVFVFFLFIGIGIGLFAKSLAATSAYLMPIMFLFGFTPMIELFGLPADSIVMKIANLFPIMLLMKIDETSSWSSLIGVVVWLIAAAVFMYSFFKKRMKDE
nr:ABC transporter permease [Evansella tamaricis]